MLFLRVTFVFILQQCFLYTGEAVINKRLTVINVYSGLKNVMGDGFPDPNSVGVDVEKTTTQRPVNVSIKSKQHNPSNHFSPLNVTLHNIIPKIPNNGLPITLTGGQYVRRNEIKYPVHTSGQKYLIKPKNIEGPPKNQLYVEMPTSYGDLTNNTSSESREINSFTQYKPPMKMDRKYSRPKQPLVLHNDKPLNDSYFPEIVPLPRKPEPQRIVFERIIPKENNDMPERFVFTREENTPKPNSQIITPQKPTPHKYTKPVVQNLFHSDLFRNHKDHDKNSPKKKHFTIYPLKYPIPYPHKKLLPNHKLTNSKLTPLTNEAIPHHQDQNLQEPLSDEMSSYFQSGENFSMKYGPIRHPGHTPHPGSLPMNENNINPVPNEIQGKGFVLRMPVLFYNNRTNTFQTAVGKYVFVYKNIQQE